MLLGKHLGSTEAAGSRLLPHFLCPGHVRRGAGPHEEPAASVHEEQQPRNFGHGASRTSHAAAPQRGHTGTHPGDKLVDELGRT